MSVRQRETDSHTHTHTHTHSLTLSLSLSHTHRMKKWQGETPAKALRSYVVDEILRKTALIMPGKL